MLHVAHGVGQGGGAEPIGQGPCAFGGRGGGLWRADQVRGGGGAGHGAVQRIASALPGLPMPPRWFKGAAVKKAV